MQANEKPADWCSGNDIAIDAIGQEFNSRARKIGPSVNNGSPLLRRFSEVEAVTPRRYAARMGLITRYTL